MNKVQKTKNREIEEFFEKKKIFKKSRLRAFDRARAEKAKKVTACALVQISFIDLSLIQIHEFILI